MVPLEIIQYKSTFVMLTCAFYQGKTFLPLQEHNVKPAQGYAYALFSLSLYSAKDAHILVKVLLDHFTKHEECPVELMKHHDESSPSFLYGITAAVAGILPQPS